MSKEPVSTAKSVFMGSFLNAANRKERKMNKKKSIKDLFETCSDDTYHVDFADMDIYYATKAKSASSSKSLRYQTIGWQIRLEANEQSISVDVKRGGSIFNR